MSANVERVEHAITETLNGMQLREANPLQEELNKLRQCDSQHWRDNLKLFAEKTKNYPGFPQICIDDGTQRMSPQGGRQLPPDQARYTPDQARYVPDQAQYNPDQRMAPTAVQYYPQDRDYRGRDYRDRDYRERDYREHRRQPDLGDRILGGLVEGFSEGVGAGLANRLLGGRGFNPGFHGGYPGQNYRQMEQQREWMRYQRQLEYERQMQRYQGYRPW